MASRSRQRRHVGLPLAIIAGVVACALFALQGSLRSGRTELYAVENLDGSLAALSSDDSHGLGGSVAAVGSSENLQGSLAGFPNDVDEIAGSVMSAAKSDDTNVNGALSAQRDADAANAAGVLDASEHEDVMNTQGALSVSSAKKDVDYHNGQSAITEMDSYFDSLPTHDVTADHSATRQRLSQPAQDNSPPAVHLSAGGFKKARNSDEEWNNKLANMKEAVRLFKTKGDKALEDAVSMGLTVHPVTKGPSSLQQSDAVLSNAEKIIAKAGQQGGVDGYRAKEYTKQVTNLKAGMAAEEKTMERLKAELSARRKQLDVEEHGKSAGEQPQEEQGKEAVNKKDDGYLNFNPQSDHWKYDEFSDFNPPASGQPTYTYVPGPNARAGGGGIAAFAHGMSKSLDSLKAAITEKQSELQQARAELIHAKQTINSALAVMDHGSDAAAEEAGQEEQPAAEEGGMQEQEEQSGEARQQLAGLDKKQQQWLGSRPDFENKNSATDGWLDYNPHSAAWGYDHHLNKNPTGGAPVYVEADHNPNGGADRIGAVQAPFQPKKVEVEVPDSFQVDEYLDSVSGTHFRKGSPQQLRGISAKGLTTKMRRDEQALDAVQRELSDAQGTLAALSQHELEHHLHEEGEESRAAEVAWDKRDMAVMAHDRHAVDALSKEVGLKQHFLSQDVAAMLALKKQRARAARAKAAVAEAAGSGAGAEGQAPAMAWLKKHVLSGLREKRSIPPHVKGRGFTTLKVGGRRHAPQQLASAGPAHGEGGEGGRVEARGLAEAMGVGMCSVLGIACS